MKSLVFAALTCGWLLHSAAHAQSNAVTELPLGTDDLALLDFTSPKDEKQLVLSQNARATVKSGTLQISAPGKQFACTLLPGNRSWDLSNYLYVALDVRNSGTQDIVVRGRVEAADNGWGAKEESVARLPAGKATTLLVYLKRNANAEGKIAARFPRMYILPNGYGNIWNGLNPDRVSKFVLAIEAAAPGISIEVDNLRAVGTCRWDQMMRPDFFPFIDRYGQFIHADWPEKIHSDADFASRRRAENEALNLLPRPEMWDQYGGFKNDPQLKANGHFRVEKYLGNWWFVDPAGHLFWSHGIDCIGMKNETSLNGRKDFFTGLPADAWVVDFYKENLKRKYGVDGQTIADSLVHERLASWGLNTIGNWSSSEVTDLHRTPYTKAIHISGPQLAHQGGHVLFDPFDPAFVRNLRAALAGEKNTTAEDPWCIGYFINNEMYWGSGPSVVNEILANPADCAAKQALMRRLKEKHPTIQQLNAVWHTDYSSWDALLHSTNKVDPAAANTDFEAFVTEMINLYYETCETELKRVAPYKLNLGSRLHEDNTIAIRASAEHCDVVSFNKYTTGVADIKLPKDLDRPVIIGEFHFFGGARGFTTDTSSNLLTEAQRADRYWYFVQSALTNPAIIGVHWFQYLDQPLSGRGDGENFPVGFVDITDTPYLNLAAEARRIGMGMYAARLGTSLKNPRESTALLKPTTASY